MKFKMNINNQETTVVYFYDEKDKEGKLIEDGEKANTAGKMFVKGEGMFWDYSIEVDKQSYPTTEHFFQHHKFAKKVPVDNKKLSEEDEKYNEKVKAYHEQIITYGTKKVTIEGIYKDEWPGLSKFPQAAKKIAELLELKFDQDSWDGTEEEKKNLTSKSIKTMITAVSEKVKQHYNDKKEAVKNRIKEFLSLPKNCVIIEDTPDFYDKNGTLTKNADVIWGAGPNGEGGNQLGIIWMAVHDAWIGLNGTDKTATPNQLTDKMVQEKMLGAQKRYSEFKQVRLNFFSNAQKTNENHQNNIYSLKAMKESTSKKEHQNFNSDFIHKEENIINNEHKKNVENKLKFTAPNNLQNNNKNLNKKIEKKNENSDDIGEDEENNIIDPYHWYYDNEIRDLLTKHYLKDSVEQDNDKNEKPVLVLNAFDIHLPQALHFFQEALAERKKQKNATTLICPLNVGGKHWIGLYIKLGKDNEETTAIYFDSLGHAMPNNVKNIVKDVFGKNTVITDHKQGPQDDDYNCGPWIVKAFDSLVKNNGKIIVESDFDINKQRKEDMVHLKEWEKEKNEKLPKNEGANQNLLKTTQENKYEKNDSLFQDVWEIEEGRLQDEIYNENNLPPWLDIYKRFYNVSSLTSDKDLLKNINDGFKLLPKTERGLLHGQILRKYLAELHGGAQWKENYFDNVKSSLTKGTENSKCLEDKNTFQYGYLAILKYILEISVGFEKNEPKKPYEINIKNNPWLKTNAISASGAIDDELIAKLQKAYINFLKNIKTISKKALDPGDYQVYIANFFTDKKNEKEYRELWTERSEKYCNYLRQDYNPVSLYDAFPLLYNLNIKTASSDKNKPVFTPTSQDRIDKSVQDNSKQKTLNLDSTNNNIWQYFGNGNINEGNVIPALHSNDAKSLSPLIEAINNIENFYPKNTFEKKQKSLAKVKRFLLNCVVFKNFGGESLDNYLTGPEKNEKDQATTKVTAEEKKLIKNLLDNENNENVVGSLLLFQKQKNNTKNSQPQSRKADEINQILAIEEKIYLREQEEDKKNKKKNLIEEPYKKDILKIREEYQKKLKNLLEEKEEESKKKQEKLKKQLDEIKIKKDKLTNGAIQTPLEQAGTGSLLGAVAGTFLGGPAAGLIGAAAGGVLGWLTSSNPTEEEKKKTKKEEEKNKQLKLDFEKKEKKSLEEQKKNTLLLEKSKKEIEKELEQEQKQKIEKLILRKKTEESLKEKKPVKNNDHTNNSGLSSGEITPQVTSASSVITNNKDANISTYISGNESIIRKEITVKVEDGNKSKDNDDEPGKNVTVTMPFSNAEIKVAFEDSNVIAKLTKLGIKALPSQPTDASPASPYSIVDTNTNRPVTPKTLAKASQIVWNFCKKIEEDKENSKEKTGEQTKHHIVIPTVAPEIDSSEDLNNLNKNNEIANEVITNFLIINDYTENKDNQEERKKITENQKNLIEKIFVSTTISQQNGGTLTFKDEKIEELKNSLNSYIQPKLAPHSLQQIQESIVKANKSYELLLVKLRTLGTLGKDEKNSIDKSLVYQKDLTQEDYYKKVINYISEHPHQTNFSYDRETKIRKLVIEIAKLNAVRETLKNLNLEQRKQPPSKNKINDKINKAHYDLEKALDEFKTPSSKKIEKTNDLLEKINKYYHSISLSNSPLDVVDNIDKEANKIVSSTTSTPPKSYKSNDIDEEKETQQSQMDTEMLQELLPEKDKHSLEKTSKNIKMKKNNENITIKEIFKKSGENSTQQQLFPEQKKSLRAWVYSLLPGHLLYGNVHIFNLLKDDQNTTYENLKNVLQKAIHLSSKDNNLFQQDDYYLTSILSLPKDKTLKDKALDEFESNQININTLENLNKKSEAEKKTLEEQLERPNEDKDEIRAAIAKIEFRITQYNIRIFLLKVKKAVAGKKSVEEIRNLATSFIKNENFPLSNIIVTTDQLQQVRNHKKAIINHEKLQDDSTWEDILLETYMSDEQYNNNNENFSKVLEEVMDIMFIDPNKLLLESKNLLPEGVNEASSYQLEEINKVLDKKPIAINENKTLQDLLSLLQNTLKDDQRLLFKDSNPGFSRATPKKVQEKLQSIKKSLDKIKEILNPKEESLLKKIEILNAYQPLSDYQRQEINTLLNGKDAAPCAYDDDGIFKKFLQQTKGDLQQPAQDPLNKNIPAKNTIETAKKLQDLQKKMGEIEKILHPPIDVLKNELLFIIKEERELISLSKSQKENANKIIFKVFNQDFSKPGEIVLPTLLKLVSNKLNRMEVPEKGYSYRLMLNDSDSAKDREIGFCVKNNKVTMKINGKEDVSLSDKKETEVKKICKTIIEANNRQDKTFTSEEIEDFSQSTLISSYTPEKKQLQNIQECIYGLKKLLFHTSEELLQQSYDLIPKTNGWELSDDQTAEIKKILEDGAKKGEPNDLKSIRIFLEKTSLKYNDLLPIAEKISKIKDLVNPEAEALKLMGKRKNLLVQAKELKLTTKELSEIVHILNHEKKENTILLNAPISFNALLPKVEELADINMLKENNTDLSLENINTLQKSQDTLDKVEEFLEKAKKLRDADNIPPFKSIKKSNVKNFFSKTTDNIPKTKNNDNETDNQHRPKEI